MMINGLLETMRGMKPILKIPFYREMVGVWKAIQLAYGIIDQDQVHFSDETENLYDEDGAWIVQIMVCLRDVFVFRDITNSCF
jgi:hypothetical protein